MSKNESISAVSGDNYYCCLYYFYKLSNEFKYETINPYLIKALNRDFVNKIKYDIIVF